MWWLLLQRYQQQRWQRALLLVVGSQPAALSLTAAAFATMRDPTEAAWRGVVPTPHNPHHS